MLLKRIIAWSCLGLALMALGPEVVLALNVGHYYPLTIMDFWQHFAPVSLDIVRMVDRSPVFFWVWNPVLTTALKIPAWGTPLVVSIYFFTISRQTSRRPLLQ